MHDKFDTYIAHCDAIVHLVGDMCGATAGPRIMTDWQMPAT
jgi:hypothetical protein